MTASCVEAVRGGRPNRRVLGPVGILIPLVLLLFNGCATRSPAPAFDRAVREAGGRGVYLREVPFYPVEAEDRRHDAVWAMVVDFWRKPDAWTRWRPGWRDLRVDLARPNKEVEVYLRAYELWAYAGQGAWEDVQLRLRAGVPPVLALYAPWELDGGRIPVLVVGYDDARGVALLYGTGDQPEEVAYGELFARWGQARQWMWTICPPDRAEWVMSDDELSGRGRYYAAVERYEEAARDFNRALERAPGQPLHYVELADAYLRLGRYDEAAALYRAALGIDGKLARAMNNLAYVHLQSDGDLNEALALAKKATVLEPRNPRILDTLGVVHHRVGDYEEAARVLQRARARALWLDGPTQAKIALHLVQVYHDAGLWHLARQTLADALTHDASLAVPEALKSHRRTPQRQME